MLVCLGLLLSSSACLLGPSPQSIKQSRALYRIGVTESNKGNYRQALAALMQALELNPNDYWLHEATGGTLLRMGQTDLALKHFREALKIEPKSPRGWNNLGSAHMVKGQWKEAISAFNKSLQNILYQTPCFSQMNLGWAYHQNKDFKNARYYLELATQTCPRICQGHRLYGISMYHQKEYTVAQQSFEQLTKLCKKFPSGHYWLARTHVAQKHFHAALSPLKDCIQSSQSFPEILRSCRQLLSQTQHQINQP